MMERFDDLVTDREVHLADVEAFSATASATDRFRDHYRVAATGGTTGRRGIFLADPQEWTQVLTSYGRGDEWAGVAAGLTNRIRMAVVSSTNPTHQSSIVGATVASRFMLRGSRSPERMPWRAGAAPVRRLAGNSEGDRLRVLLAGSAKIDAAGTAATAQRALEAVGVRGIRVTVDLVDTIPRTALGKAPVIHRAQLATAGH